MIGCIWMGYGAGIDADCTSNYTGICKNPAIMRHLRHIRFNNYKKGTELDEFQCVYRTRTITGSHCRCKLSDYLCLYCYYIVHHDHQRSSNLHAFLGLCCWLFYNMNHIISDIINGDINEIAIIKKANIRDFRKSDIGKKFIKFI